jgi:UDP-GlcNAc:undecaprenyl-phosphate GlcNAc-1-phosphate transferase
MMTVALLMVFVVSLGLSLLLVPFARTIAFRFRLLDCPDGQRKLQARPLPVAGGIAIFLAGSIAVAAASFVPGPLAEPLTAPDAGLPALLLAALVLCMVGIADDYGRLGRRQKLAGQIVAVALVVCSGLVVRSIRVFGWDFELGPLAVSFTFLWLLVAINSHNLLDGMDGLLSSFGLIVCATLAVMAVLGGQWPSACVTCALAGALLGFLRYNFPPASIILGDCGSMLIGLLVGVFTLREAMTDRGAFALATPTALLVLPFLDITAAIIRRRLTGRSIFTTDRGHLHHCLLRRGLSPQFVLVVITLFGLVAAAGAMTSWWRQNDFYAVLSAVSVVATLVASRLFGDTEWLLLSKKALALLSSLTPRRGNGADKRFEVRLQGSAAWQDIWNDLTIRASQLGLVSMRFNVNAPALHECYHAIWSCSCGEIEESKLWRVDIPLAVAGQTVARLELSGRRSDLSASTPFADIAKLAEQFGMAVGEVAEITAAAKAGEAKQPKRRRGPHPVPQRPHALTRFARFSKFIEGTTNS